MSITLRSARPPDTPSWLRCRALSFPSTRWVAVGSGGEVLGILDVEPGAEGAEEAGLATIDAIAVHPDHEGRGIATAPLEALIARPPEGTGRLDAWTREDVARAPQGR